MQRLTILLLLLSTTFSYAQLTGDQLLDKAIQYHDPNGVWETFQGTFFVTIETPNKPNRDSEIKIDLPNEYFSLKWAREYLGAEYYLNKGQCQIQFSKKNPTPEEEKNYRLDCDGAKLYKNYYTYLYGLPMKLKDKGTNIDEKVERRTFKGKEYLVLKVTYDQEVGKDTWFFYFDPKTYAMEVKEPSILSNFLIVGHF